MLSNFGIRFLIKLILVEIFDPPMIIKKNKDNSIFSVAGGGDTIAVLNQINAISDFNFVSTAGGAFLEYLEGKELPGIKALN